MKKEISNFFHKFRLIEIQNRDSVDDNREFD